MQGKAAIINEIFITFLDKNRKPCSIYDVSCTCLEGVDKISNMIGDYTFHLSVALSLNTQVIEYRAVIASNRVMPNCRNLFNCLQTMIIR